MGFFDRGLITDVHVRDVADREDITGQLAALDNEIRAVCIARGVPAASIPVNDSGYITSASLKRFATFWLYFTILHDYWGGTGMDMGVTQDIYKEKLGYYEQQMMKAKNDLTAANILEGPLNQSSYIRSVVVY